MFAKNWMFSLSALLLLSGAVALAQDEGGRRGGDRDRDGDDRRREEFLKRFDTNGDGQLSEEERQAGFEQFRQEREQRREEFMKRFDTNGDGQLSDEERQNIAKTFREEREKQDALNKYDEDKDGILNDSEKAKMEADKQAQETQRQERQAELLKKFDANGNGKIDGDEVNSIKKHVQDLQSQIRAVSELARGLQDSDSTTARALMDALRPQDGGPRFGGFGDGGPGGREGRGGDRR